MHFEKCSGFVDKVYGFIRKKTVVDEPRAHVNCIFDNALAIFHVVIFFVFVFQTIDDFYTLVGRRFGNLDVLETSNHALAFGEIALVFIERG